MKTFRRREEGKPEKRRKEATLGLKPWLRSRMGCLAKCLRLGWGSTRVTGIEGKGVRGHRVIKPGHRSRLLQEWLGWHLAPRKCLCQMPQEGILGVENREVRGQCMARWVQRENETDCVSWLLVVGSRREALEVSKGHLRV